MVKGHLGPLYWGRCLVRSHKGRGFYKDEWGVSVCWLGYFIEWYR